MSGFKLKRRIFGAPRTNTVPGHSHTIYDMRFFTIILAFLSPFSCLFASQGIWEESSAGVRAIVEVPKGGPAVTADILWRLPFNVEENPSPEAMWGKISVYDASSGRQVRNVHVRELSADRVILAFGPADAGTYHVYFSYGGAKPSRDYEYSSTLVWAKEMKLFNYPDFNKLPKMRADGVEMRYRPQGNPYDAASTVTEADAYFTKKSKTPFQAYYVPGEYPVNDAGRLPLAFAAEVVKNTEEGKTGGFFGRVFRGRTSGNGGSADTLSIVPGGKKLMQICLVGTKGTTDVTVSFPSAPSAGIHVKPVGRGKLKLRERDVRSVWAVASADSAAADGRYEFSVKISGAGREQTVRLVVEVRKTASSDAGGYADAEFISLVGAPGPGPVAVDDVNPRFPVTMSQGYDVRSGNNVLSINPATALPGQIFSKGSPLLSSPVLLVFSTSNGTRKIGVDNLMFSRRDGGVQQWSGSIRTHDMDVKLSGSLAAYGMVEYDVDVMPLQDISFRNVSLEFGFAPDITSAGYDTVRVLEKGAVSLSGQDASSGMWIGRDRRGVYVSVPAVNGNMFYSGDNASLTLYNGSGMGLVAGTGAFGASKGVPFSLKCRMQLLPADYSAENPSERNLYLVRGDTLPEPGDIPGAGIAVVRNPDILFDTFNVARMEKLVSSGVRLAPRIEPFSLPGKSAAARVLASLDYPYVFSADGRNMMFEASDSLKAAFVYMYGLLTENPAVGGVVLVPSLHNMENAYAYSQRGGDGFMVFTEGGDGFDASMFMAAPWVDGVLETVPCYGDAAGGLCAGSGLKPYSALGDRTVWDALLSGADYYADDTDSTASSAVMKVWKLRREMGVDASGYLFYPAWDASIPVVSSSGEVKISAYESDGRLVVICRNSSPEPVKFVPQFDLKALGVKKWEVERLEAPALDCLQDAAYYLLGDSVEVPASSGVVLTLTWGKLHSSGGKS